MVNSDAGDVGNVVCADDDFVGQATLFTALLGGRQTFDVANVRATIDEQFTLTSRQEDDFQVQLAVVLNEWGVLDTLTPSTRTNFKRRGLAFFGETAIDHVLVRIGGLVLEHHHVAALDDLRHTTLERVLLATLQRDRGHGVNGDEGSAVYVLQDFADVGHFVFSSVVS